MRFAIALVSLLAIAVIVGSTALVVTKDDAPQLSVEVTGVPGYVYYNRAYDLTVEYANLAGAVDGPVELSVDLPETFALAEYISDPARRGERLTWTLDGLGAGERGSIPITVQGVLPDDLTNAVYDLPGYAGHTAFVEGFDLGVTLTAGDATASTLAVADTGTTRTLTIIKDCGGLTSGDTDQEFTWSFVPTTQDPTPPTLAPLTCGGQQTVGFPSGAFLYTLVENVPEGWSLGFNYVTDCPTLTNIGSLASVTNGFSFATPPSPTTAEVSCTFTNTPDRANLTIDKVCDEGDTSETQFEITLTPDPSDVNPITLGCGDSPAEPIQIDPFTEYTISETPPEGYAPATFEGDCAPDGVVELGAGESGACTVVNSLQFEGLRKYTDESDEVVGRLEEFSWYIDVPVLEGGWFLWDFLPPGFILTGVNAPEGVECDPILVFGVVCRGSSREEIVTIEIRVVAPLVCTHYKNVAKLFFAVELPQFAWDIVTVDCDASNDNEEEEVIEESIPAGMSWWERLWIVLFE